MSSKQHTRIFTSLDLELNQNKETGPKIIQIGAVVGNIDTGEILEKLSVFVNPHQQLEPFIIQLTKIKQEQVDQGVSILEAYNKLKDLHIKYGSFVNPITWGQGDVRELMDEVHNYVHLHNIPEGIQGCFGRRILDAKTLYVSWRIVNKMHPTGGLSRAMANLGVKFNGCAHRADDDAENTFLIFKKLLSLFPNICNIQ